MSSPPASISPYSSAHKRSAVLRGYLMVLLIGVMAVGTGCKKGEGRDEQSPSLTIIKTKLGVEMVRIPGGWFDMGSGDGEPNERPVHRVWVDAFLIDRTEVTQEQFRRLQIPDPSHFKDPARPVEQVTMCEVIEFCNERSETEGFRRAYIVDDERGAWRCDFSADGYRLPTEAEWEYASRAGSTADRYYGNDDPRCLRQHAWFTDNSSKRTSPAARKRPNPWGLYDMYGNVAEWCNDYYQEDYYARSPQRNPRGPSSAKLVVLRGGSWNSPPEHCRSPWRAGESPTLYDICFAKDTIGFRCVRSVPSESPPSRPALSTEAEHSYDVRSRNRMLTGFSVALRSDQSPS